MTSHHFAEEEVCIAIFWLDKENIPRLIGSSIVVFQEWWNALDKRTH